MGSCLSSDSGNVSTVKVITLNGVLQEFSFSVRVEHVLQSENTPCFVCLADSMYFNDYIPALNSDDELQVGQIYFVLPASRLQYPLEGSDMAALAVKASSALEKTKKGRGKKIRVAPLVNFDQQQQTALVDERFVKYEKVNQGLARSGSVRKFQRSFSIKAKVAYRSFRTRLSTIYEGSI